MNIEHIDQLLRMREASYRTGEQLDLRGIDLQGYDLSEIVLYGAQLSGASLDALTMIGINLGNADLQEANLSNANLMRADLRGANLSGADLRESILVGADLSDTKIHDSDLRKATLRGADFSRASCYKSRLDAADLRGANLSNVSLNSTTLQGTDFRGAIIVGVNFQKAKFSKTKFEGAYFRSVVMPNGKSCHDNEEVFRVLRELRGTEESPSSSSGQPTGAFEYLEHVIDLHSYDMYIYSGDRENEDAAWTEVSPAIFDVISEFGKQGWELVDQNIGPNLLVLESASDTRKGFLMNFVHHAFSTEGTTPRTAARVIGARLHFRRPS